jgi:putative transposase
MRNSSAGDASVPDYRRLHIEGGTYFFTANLLERRKTLLTDHFQLFRQSFLWTKRRWPFLKVIAITPCGCATSRVDFRAGSTEKSGAAKCANVAASVASGSAGIGNIASAMIAISLRVFTTAITIPSNMDT